MPDGNYDKHVTNPAVARAVIAVALLVLLAVYLAAAWAWGVRFDYRYYVTQWADVLAGQNPWASGDAINPNAYGPVHSALAPLWGLHPLLPKIVFAALQWALVAGAVVTARRRGWSFVAQSVLLVVLATAPLGVLLTVLWGAHDVLAAALCVGAVWCRMRERAVTAAILIATAVLFKYYPLALVPFLALDRRGFSGRFAIAFVVSMAAGVAASMSVWGGSMWSPLMFASAREAKPLSVFAFLEGPYSPLGWVASGPIAAGALSLPAMTVAGGAAFGLAWWTRMPVAAGAALASLVALTFYHVGHFQFHIPVVALFAWWLVSHTEAWRRSPRLAAAGAAYLLTINGLCVLYAVTNRMDDDYRWLRGVVGLPMFLASAWLIVETSAWAWLTRHERVPKTEVTPEATLVCPTRSVAVIVPTYREAENLPELLDRLAAVRSTHGLDLTAWIMDDDSRDGTAGLVAARDEPWVRLVTRTTDRGLSPAVLEGLHAAASDVLLVMDADLSHPPERIPALLAALDAGADFVIGSRYVPGGTTDEDWGFSRWLNSKTATWLARPLTRVNDPMAGFFALRRETFEQARWLNPVGYKIGLELIVKCGCRRVAEVPIHFADRKGGESKLNLAEQLRYIQHLRRLFLFKHAELSCLLQFVIVGAAGTAVNLLVLSVLHAARVPFSVAIAVAIVVSLAFNFVLNRRFTFSFARHGSALKQFAGYAMACAVGAGINYAVAVTLFFDLGEQSPRLAALAGIAAGGGINFVFNRLLVFRRTEGGTHAPRPLRRRRVQHAH